jgi:deaminated glutathione amidase
MKEEHWITMLKARAIENGVYVIAPNQVGNIFCGRSMIVDPLGSILTDLGDRTGIEIVEIQRERIDEVRKTLPLLKNRRADIYNINILN